jgi:phage head maturation protease
MSTLDLPPTVRADRPPLDSGLRTAPFALRAADPDAPNDGRTLDGFGAVFEREVIIDSWEGRFKEKISLGSMKKSFREKPPKIQFDHGRHPLVGSIPIARLTSITEETDPELAPDGGAHIVGRLHDNWLVEPVREAIAEETIDGMSFRFTVVREVWYDEDGKQVRDEDKLMELLRRTWFEDVPDEELLLRDLRELKVPEMGPVVWPAYPETSVGVRSKSVVIDLGHLDDPEQRKNLARAVFLADVAERMNAGDPPQATDLPAGEHGDPAEDDEPRATEDDPAGEHPSQEEETPQATEESSAGEHDIQEGTTGRTQWSPHALGSSADWYLPAADEATSSVI